MFSIWSSFTNCGLSLSDTSMVPFQKAYLYVIITTITILAGNTAYVSRPRATMLTLAHLVRITILTTLKQVYEVSSRSFTSSANTTRRFGTRQSSS